MYIKSFSIENYKSFHDSGRQELTPGFNVILGQNNAGKTALIEALSGFPRGAKPHRNSKQPYLSPIPPNSSIDLTVQIPKSQLHIALLRGDNISFPIPPQMTHQQSAKKFIGDFFNNDQIFNIKNTASNVFSSVYPSHCLFDSAQSSSDIYARLRRIQYPLGYRFIDIQSGINDIDAGFLGDYYNRNIYSFLAERLGLGSCKVGPNKTLHPDARNLAEVLSNLQSNSYKFSSYNKLVNYIFPNVKGVSIFNKSNDIVEIGIWNISTPPGRDDLIQPLSESGTGLGQILSILYILVTSVDPQVIIIDEPNTFLHPGAIRRLFHVMQQNPAGHQFIISTHSPEVIAAAKPETIHLVCWEDEQSKIESLSTVDANDLRRALREVGARLADVFGADQILWVEGPSEVECFPKILDHFNHPLSIGSSVISLPNTGDLERKRGMERIWEIFEKLSSGNALLPQTIAFSLDREDKSQTNIDDLGRRSKGLIKFTARRSLENYLVRPGAIVFVLNLRPTFSENPIELFVVEDWISKKAKRNKYAGRSGVLKKSEPDWIKELNAPKLLSDLFSELSDNKEYFDKMRDCPLLTDWILQNEPDELKELAEYLIDLTGEADHLAG
jgi:hypothetical protein